MILALKNGRKRDDRFYSLFRHHHHHQCVIGASIYTIYRYNNCSANCLFLFCFGVFFYEFASLHQLKRKRVQIGQFYGRVLALSLEGATNKIVRSRECCFSLVLSTFYLPVPLFARGISAEEAAKTNTKMGRGN